MGIMITGKPACPKCKEDCVVARVHKEFESPNGQFFIFCSCGALLGWYQEDDTFPIVQIGLNAFMRDRSISIGTYWRRPKNILDYWFMNDREKFDKCKGGV